MTSGMLRARRENRSERRRRDGERDLRGGGREADSGERQRGCDAGSERERERERRRRMEERGRGGKRVDSLVAWTAELCVEEEMDAQLLSTRFGAD